MMSDERRDKGFLGRWSRLKTDARETQAQPPADAPLPVEAKQADEMPPELPAVDTLTMDSDFRGFLHPKVDEDLRRSALRKLFSDPHFNVMDGLDVYIDDYSISEPIPAEMLAGMKQAQRILRWAEGGYDETLDEGRAEEDAAREAALSAPAPEPTANLVAVADEPPSDIPQASEPLPQAVAKPE
jgi:hypothetical protein